MIRFEMPRNYEGVAEDTNFSMEESEDSTDLTAYEDAFSIKIGVGEKSFMGLALGDDKEPLSLQHSDITINYDEGWRQRADLNQKGYQLVNFSTGPTGQPPTMIYRAYVRKGLLPQIERLFMTK